MAGTDGRLVYVCIQFCGILIKALPLLFLLSVPYGIRQMKVFRRIILLLMAGAIILAGAAEAGMMYVGCRETGEQEAVSHICGNVLFLIVFAVETAVYFLSVKKDTGTRLLTYLIVLHYGVFLYVVTETAGKFLEIRDIGGLGSWSVVRIVIYLIITVITYPFIYRLLKQHRAECFCTADRKKCF